MARSQEAQRQRTQYNPLVLGDFDATTLRYLKGRLGPLNQITGSADTNQQSNGGFGGGSYNHWFQINLKSSAWIIVVKSGPRPSYIQTSVYDLDKKPIEGRSIFQADSVTLSYGTVSLYPYLGTVMGAQSDLYNTFDRGRLDKGDERYYPLNAGSYLLCVSTTRNELIDYEVGVVIEFPITEMVIALEDEDTFSLCLQETLIDDVTTLTVESPVVSNLVISSTIGQPNGFTLNSCTINSGIVVTVLSGSEWFIGDKISADLSAGYGIFVDAPVSYFDSIHDHSLTEWQESWENTHQDTDKFPTVFIPYTNRP